MSDTAMLHASSVCFDGRGVLIKGASGSGKSSFALQLLAYGATLIADDATEVRRADNSLWLFAPKATQGLIEARGVGVLQAETVQNVPLFLMIDLDQPEPDRLPHPHSTHILGVSVTSLHNPGTTTFPAAVLQYLKAGRHE